MDDLISLRAAIERLRAERAKYEGKDGWDLYRDGLHDAEIILRAIPADEAANAKLAARVKPLVWVKDDDDPDLIKAGDYDIYHEGHEYQVYFWSIEIGERARTVEDAKSFAFTHHEARILAALSPEPAPAAPATEPAAWRVDNLSAKGNVTGDHRIFSEQETADEYVERCGRRFCKVTPLYAHPADADLRAEVARLKEATDQLQYIASANAARAERAETEVARLREALRPFAFLDSETAQAAWEIRYRDRFEDWIDFADIETARAALAGGPRHG